MKLYLNDTQKKLLLEILRASQQNAVNGNDAELAISFQDLYSKVEPDNLAYVNLDRGEAEAIVDFCDIVRGSLEKTIMFLESDKDRDPSEVEDLKQKAISFRDEIQQVGDQLQEKIRKNPTKEGI